MRVRRLLPFRSELLKLRWITDLPHQERLEPFRASTDPIRLRLRGFVGLLALFGLV